ncbi:MAG: hypothetical protein IJ584_06470 [Bacteroidales bacterium]|nr:hypothetical protein [Bacteroidales bacterium]MBR1434735.1 hypothetical protein [Bacteroidales bacterium]
MKYILISFAALIMVCSIQNCSSNSYFKNKQINATIISYFDTLSKGINPNEYRSIILFYDKNNLTHFSMISSPFEEIAFPFDWDSEDIIEYCTGFIDGFRVTIYGIPKYRRLVNINTIKEKRAECTNLSNKAMMCDNNFVISETCIINNKDSVIIIDRSIPFESIP